MPACPLEGLVRSVVFCHETSADFCYPRNINAISATFSTIALSFSDALKMSPNAAMTFKNVQKIGL